MTTRASSRAVRWGWVAWKWNLAHRFVMDVFEQRLTEWDGRRINFALLIWRDPYCWGLLYRN